METQLLRDQEVLPTDQVIKASLPPESHFAYEEFTKLVTEEPFLLTMDWHYYKDGKSWLCKVCNKKKTVFWLSIWENYFQLTLFFTAKTCDGVYALDIDEAIKTEFSQQKATGKLIPLFIRVKTKEQLSDTLKIVSYKKSLK